MNVKAFQHGLSLFVAGVMAVAFTTSVISHDSTKNELALARHDYHRQSNEIIYLERELSSTKDEGARRLIGVTLPLIEKIMLLQYGSSDMESLESKIDYVADALEGGGLCDAPPRPCPVSPDCKQELWDMAAIVFDSGGSSQGILDIYHMRAEDAENALEIVANKLLALRGAELAAEGDREAIFNLANDLCGTRSFEQWDQIP